MIVDIRELPISRKPGFTQAALAMALVNHGIRFPIHKFVNISFHTR
jgi:Domain of unknown function DUF488